MKLFLYIVIAGSFLATSAHAAPEPLSIAIVDFDYVDTSGEPRDQTADHARRLRDFMSALRRDLGRDDKFRVVALDCGAEACAVGKITPRDLFDAAKKAGARLVLYGGVHKMSTLVQWATAQLVDVEKDRLVDNHWLTFRGDDDEAWRRAEVYLARRLAEAPIEGK
ncbi:DUF2380 domain-containing protein [Methylocystis parvus]|nr:DUF2380 domain-containing protein [Methylocystis parvus]WBJ98435.1 DUF3280 domain-containing protein [Methylocystis parvus OBBP]